MSLQKMPELQRFLSLFSSADVEADLQILDAFLSTVRPEDAGLISVQARELMASDGLTEALGMEANRWFGDEEEAKTWLESLLMRLNVADSGGTVAVKDSNGALLSEGDAVTVIKDLVVKGGSSDLKRGTLIRKIHLIGDPNHIECNVNGSTLVLKTMFLKKA